MKTGRLITYILIITLSLLSCVNNKKAELDRLKKQKNTLDEKIKTIENSNDLSVKDPLDTAKFRFVGVTRIKPDSFDHFIRVQGKLDGEQNVAVFADISGIISEKYADVGKDVSKGQILATIDAKQYISQLQGLETQYKLASDLFEKQKRLWDQKIGSEVQYLQSKTNKESLEQQISSLKDQIEKFKIKSPVNGTIEECNVKEGSVVTPDPRTPAYRVVAFRNLKVDAEVSEAYASNVKTGDRVLISFPDIDTEIETRVDFVSRYINPLNRTFTVESNIPDKHPGMKANMIAVVRINDYHSENAIQIPVNVIQTDENGSYVYVVREKDNYSSAAKQPVVIGNTYNGVAEILKGLGKNDQVITSGFQELIDGEFIRFNKSL
jgi:membrane fusion protein (multidrug efflux system)